MPGTDHAVNLQYLIQLLQLLCDTDAFITLGYMSKNRIAIAVFHGVHV